MKSGRQSRASQNQIPPSSTRFVLETVASKFAHHGQWPPVTYLRIALCIIRGILLGHGTTPGQWPSAFQKMFSIAQTLVFRAGTFRFVRTPLFVIDDVLDCCQSCRDLLSQKLPPATIRFSDRFSDRLAPSAYLRRFARDLSALIRLHTAA